MIAKYVAAGLLGTALLTGSALAQTTTPAPRADSSMSATSSMSHQGLWRASKLVGVNVYNDSNESLGSINDLIVDNSGNIKNVIIGVGGFLGVGERYIAVSFDKLKWSNDPVRTAASTPPAAGMDSNRTVGSTSTTPITPTTATVPTTSKADSWYPDHAVLSATKDDVKSMPEFKY
jgi:sporulation protein YlmC with PRC-barrel domain